MQPIPKEQIIKRHQSLPKTLQDAIFSEKNAGIIIKVCALRDISEKATFLVGQLMSRVLLGYIRPENFVSEIQKETGVSEMTAQLVAHDIDGEIFSNVRLELKKLYPPVIQTPTIQSPSFGLKATTNQSDNSNLQPKPKYVIPIPEKFRSTNYESRITNQESKATNQELQIKNHETEKEKKVLESTPQVQENTKSTQPIIHDSRFVIQEDPKPSQSTQAQQKPEIPKPQIVDSKPQPEFKPIVPLPTFIRSQFKMEEPKKTAKDFIGKFGAPDPTLAKPEAPKTDPYKEQIQ